MQNQIANALATMASMMDGPRENDAQLIVVEQKEEPAYCMLIEKDEGMNGEGEWYSGILQYLKDRTYPKSANNNHQLIIKRLSSNYIICGKRLYRRSYNGIHLLCVTTKEAQEIIEEVYESSYGPHMNAHMLSQKIMRQGYYWTTIEANCYPCSEMPSMPSPWKSKALATYAITYHDFTLAVLYMGNIYHWEDSPTNIQWP